MIASALPAAVQAQNLRHTGRGQDHIKKESTLEAKGLGLPDTKGGYEFGTLEAYGVPTVVMEGEGGASSLAAAHNSRNLGKGHSIGSGGDPDKAPKEEQSDAESDVDERTTQI